MKKILILLALTMVSSVSLADAFCGANGEFNPQEQRCVPNQNRGGGQNTPAYVDNRDMYGAMAIDAVTGGGGGGGKAFSPARAAELALEVCKRSVVKNIGTKFADNCKVVSTFKNSCGTIASAADSKGRSVWADGFSKKHEEDALQNALTICDKKAIKAGISRPEPCGMWVQAFCTR